MEPAASAPFSAISTAAVRSKPGFAPFSPSAISTPSARAAASNPSMTTEQNHPAHSSSENPARCFRSPADPHRDRYSALFVRALQAAIAALDPRDEERLRLYYAQEQTLAEIGRQLGEHESSVSRNLDRIRLVLRRTVEETLRNGCPAVNGFAAELGLSEAQISLCFEYASADAPFDLEKLLERRSRPSPPVGRPDP